MAEISSRAPPAGITGFLVGLRSPEELSALQEAIEAYRGEPLTAVAPAAAFEEFGDLAADAERLLRFFGACAVLAGLAGLAAVMVSGVGERRAEFAAWRISGAAVRQCYAQAALEALVLALAGALLGVIAGHIAAAGAASALGERLGLVLDSAGPGVYDLVTVLAVTSAAAAVGLLPAWLACRRSQSDASTTEP